MVTLMWKRALKLAASAKETPLNSNWLIHSTHLNGLSSAFTKSMGKLIIIKEEQVKLVAVDSNKFTFPLAWWFIRLSKIKSTDAN